MGPEEQEGYPTLEQRMSHSPYGSDDRRQAIIDYHIRNNSYQMGNSTDTGDRTRPEDTTMTETGSKRERTKPFHEWVETTNIKGRPGPKRLTKASTTRANDKDNEGYTEVKRHQLKMTPVNTAELDSKKYRVGVRITTVADRGKSEPSKQTLVAMCNLITAIDPDTVILDHKNNPVTAIRVHQMKSVDNTRSRFNTNTTKWKIKSRDCERTTISMYVASNTVQPKLRELIDDPDLQDFMKKHNILLHPHKLSSSAITTLCHAMGKSVRHTNRIDMENRIEEALREEGVNSKVHCETIPVRIGKKQYQTIGMSIASVEALKATKILEVAKFPFLDLLFPHEKHRDKERFEKLILISDKMAKESQAIRVGNISQDQVRQLRVTLLAIPDVAKIIIDVPRARTKDMVYVQYKKGHQALAESGIKRAINLIQPEDGLSGRPVMMINGDSNSIENTIYQGTLGTAAPESRFEDMIPETSFPSMVRVKKPRKKIAAQESTGAPMKSYADVAQETNQVMS